MTFTPPYTNTFRTINLDFSNGTGVANTNINIPFPIDEIIFRGLMSAFPPTPIQTVYTIYTCPLLTDDFQAPVGFCHYTSAVDTFQSSSGTVLSYMYASPKYINGQYSFYEENSNGIFTVSTLNTVIFVEFRKYN